MSDGSQVSHKLLQRLAEKRAAEEAAKAEQDNDLSKWAEFVPDIDLDESPGLSKMEIALDEFMRLIPITEAYQRWGGQSAVNSSKKELKVRCPNPEHTDKEPSFVMNTEKNVFNCFKCGGGDIYDIAAWHKGFPVPGYKDKAYFRDLKDSIAADYGMQIDRSLGGEETLYKAEIPSVIDIDDGATTKNENTGSEPGTNVLYTPQGAAYAEPTLDERIESKRQHAAINWRSIVPEGTFMRAYLDATTTDACPEEYHFWSALMAVGMSAGLNRVLRDGPPVTANLFVCLTGPTGTGKSRAKKHLFDLIYTELPYKHTDILPQGTKVIGNPQSGEVIVKSFQHEVLDVNDKPIPGQFLPIRVLVNSEELAGIAARSSRQGSTLKDTMMDLYDCKARIESQSLANPLSAPHPFGSVVTTTQNKSIREVISKKDNSSGFVNRWVFATGVPKPERAINKTHVDLLRAGGLLRLINGECSTRRVIDWSPEAESAWEHFFHARVVPDKKRGDEAEVFQRIDLLLKKLFLLFTINNRELVVTGETVKRVLEIYPYLLESYDVIGEQVSATSQGDDEDYVLSVVSRMARQGKQPTARDVFQMTKKRIPNTGMVRKILENFVALGELQEFKVPPGPAGGKPRCVFVPHGMVISK